MSTPEFDFKLEYKARLEFANSMVESKKAVALALLTKATAESSEVLAERNKARAELTWEICFVSLCGSLCGIFCAILGILSFSFCFFFFLVFCSWLK